MHVDRIAADRDGRARTLAHQSVQCLSLSGARSARRALRLNRSPEPCSPDGHVAAL